MNKTITNKLQNIAFYFVVGWIVLSLLVVGEIMSTHLYFGEEHLSLKMKFHEMLKK